MYVFLFQSFRKVIELEPSNTEAIHNLCVVYVERGYLLEAEKCLAHVHTLAPKEEYIVNHLNIVRGKIQEYRKKQQEAKAAETVQGQEGQKSEGKGQTSEGQEQGQIPQDQEQGGQ